MKLKRLVSFLLILISIYFLSSCNLFNKLGSSNLKKQIVTTLYPEYDMINKIIGTNEETKGLFDVTLIIPPGQDSHTYDPSINDLIKIKNADLFIYTADEMETWVKNINFSEKTKVVNLSKHPKIELFKAQDEDANLSDDHHDHDHEHNHVHEYDPHYWVYPIYAKYMVERIFESIEDIISDPYKTITPILQKNRDEYINSLEEIDLDIRKIVALANINNRNTMYFGSPFSFYYWHVFYGLDYKLTYATCSTESEPPINVLIDIINDMKENNIKVIFAKELLNQEACETISYHTDAKILVLHSGHNVSVEDFNDPNMSYLKILRQNVENLKELLKVYNMEGGN